MRYLFVAKPDAATGLHLPITLPHCHTDHLTASIGPYKRIFPEEEKTRLKKELNFAQGGHPNSREDARRTALHQMRGYCNEAPDTSLKQ